jgi:hypothetical protein
MTFGLSLALLSSLIAGSISLITILKANRSVPRWSFGIGMAALAFESFCAGLAIDALLPEQVVYWETLALLAASLLPGLWLVFSLSYGRGHYMELLVKWRICLCAFLVLPVALTVVFQKHLLFAVAQPEGRWLLRVGTAGLALNLLVLLGSVLVLMNLENTFRASVGMMRWRIKYMVLGLGALFAVRAYSSTQLLLFKAVDPSLQNLNSCALLISSLLILRSILRVGHFDVSVYPSQSVLYNSFTVLLAGIYLVVVGVSPLSWLRFSVVTRRSN